MATPLKFFHLLFGPPFAIPIGGNINGSVFMTMNENCKQLQNLVRMRYSKEMTFYSLPKTNNSQELLENEIAVSLIQNKNLRSFFKADELVIPVYRGTSLDGAVIIKDADSLDKSSCLQITELVELLVTEIMSLGSILDGLKQKEDQLEKQVRLTDIYHSETMVTNAIH